MTLVSPMLAHSLVAAHAERVTELARLYSLLERAVSARAADSDAARNVHCSLSARIAEWDVADMEDERRNVISLTAEEREALLRDIDRAISHAEPHAEGSSPNWGGR